MFYLLVMLLFAYLLPVSLNSLAFLFYLQRADFAQCYTVLSDFRPIEDGDKCHVTK